MTKISTYQEKNAYVIFGGVGSGKTSLANSLEAKDEVIVIGTDRLSYEKDMKARFGVRVDTVEIRNRRISEGMYPNIALDEMVKSVFLEPLVASGYSITAVFLKITESCRRGRFENRVLRQTEVLRRLSVIIGIDIVGSTRKHRRGLWTDKAFCDQVAHKDRDEFENLVQELYYSGAVDFNDSVPDPIDFNGIDYVVELNDDEDLSAISVAQIRSMRVPHGRYKNERNCRPIEICVWDIGNVLYRFSLSPLLRLTQRETSRPEEIDDRKKKFSFGPYMRGEINFTGMCQSFCDAFEIEYSREIEREIESAFKKGIGETIDITVKTISWLSSQGIKNAALSNALPILENASTVHGLFEEHLKFFSFGIGFLKPEEEAFWTVLKSVGVEPENALFVDDKQINTSAALRLGMAAITFDAETFEKHLRYQFPNTLQWETWPEPDL